MIRLQPNERGALNVLVLPLVGVSLLFVVALVFGVYAFTNMQDYKNNSDDKSAVAVEAAVQKDGAKKAAEFAEQAKNPLKTYNGPAAYGSLLVQYPKTWSAYVVEQSNEGSNIDGYFNPNYVPSVTSQTSSFALRTKVIGQSYATVLQTFQGLIKNQKLTAAPYAFPKVPNTIGTRLSGQILSGKQGTMIVVPLRDNTLEIWTEGTSATADFENSILPNVSFSP
ncbi:hypothetical protein H7097_02615 [Aeromicrobium sp.]|nr:hypothetical protein [Candidatus Saccharibacteria bacterium]